MHLKWRQKSSFIKHWNKSKKKEKKVFRTADTQEAAWEFLFQVISWFPARLPHQRKQQAGVEKSTFKQ